MKFFQFFCNSTLITQLGFSFSVLAFEGKVLGISDGDTITDLDNYRVQHKIR